MKEFRVSLPTQAGQLAQVSEAMAHRGVNILSLAAVQATNLVTAVALVVARAQEEEARTTLQGLGLHCTERDLLTMKIQDKPGAVAEITRKLADAHINIESIYFLGTAPGEELAFSVDQVDRAKETLKIK